MTEQRRLTIREYMRFKAHVAESLAQERAIKSKPINISGLYGRVPDVPGRMRAIVYRQPQSKKIYIPEYQLSFREQAELHRRGWRRGHWTFASVWMPIWEKDRAVDAQIG